MASRDPGARSSLSQDLAWPFFLRAYGSIINIEGDNFEVFLLFLGLEMFQMFRFASWIGDDFAWGTCWVVGLEIFGVIWLSILAISSF